MIERLSEIERRFEEVEHMLMDPAVNSNPKQLQTLGKTR